jgi:2-polyprenyl-3-methyl-5-hydroxy-6-metoxy-1,4-benzoquinol methylase
MQDRNPTPLARDGVHEKVIEYLKDKPKGRILDVPTGFGALARKLSEMNFAVSCCDIDTDQFSAQGLQIDRGDLNGKIPYGDNEFDYVCFLEAIEHTENPYNAVREIARVLKPGGILIMSTPNYLNIERRLKFLVTGFFTKPVPQKIFRERFHGQTYAMHLSPIGYTLVRFILEYAGLHVIEMTYDKKKPKQLFLKPLVWLIRLYALSWSKEKREQYWLPETLGNTILDGGNTLIIVAQKSNEAMR